jgi:hypothetical protein
MNPTPAAPKGATHRLDQDPEWWAAPLYRNEELIERPADQTTLTRRYTEDIPMIKASLAVQVLAVVALAVGLSAGAARAAAGDSGNDPSRPNILFILCDDLGIKDLHCYGRQDHRTPNLDEEKAEPYDLRKDIAEAQDLAALQPERVDQMRAALAAWRKTVNSQENTPNPDFDAAKYRQLYEDVDASRFDPATANQAQWEKMWQWRKEMNAAVAGAKSGKDGDIKK